jgi:hypothetical protein
MEHCFTPPFILNKQFFCKNLDWTTLYDSKMYFLCWKGKEVYIFSVTIAYFLFFYVWKELTPTTELISLIGRNKCVSGFVLKYALNSVAFTVKLFILLNLNFYGQGSAKLYRHSSLLNWAVALKKESFLSWN